MSWGGQRGAGWAKLPVGSLPTDFGFLGCIHRAHHRLGQADLVLWVACWSPRCDSQPAPV